MGGFTIKTVPKGSSNKPQTLVDIGDPKLTQGHSQAKAPTPFIDRISITLKVPTKQEGQVMWSAHWNAVADQQTYVPHSTEKVLCQVLQDQASIIDELEDVAALPDGM